MIEKFNSEKLFTKDKDNLEMLKESLASEEIDGNIVTILEKFYSLPITPRESCYGQVEELKEPYLNFVEDETSNEQDKNFQKLFKENITKLTVRINQKIGSNVVDITLEEIDHGGGPKDYTLRFKIIDKKAFQEFGKKFLNIIWEEFSEYLDEIR